jgi:hypothetical protein
MPVKKPLSASIQNVITRLGKKEYRADEVFALLDAANEATRGQTRPGQPEMLPAIKPTETAHQQLLDQLVNVFWDETDEAVFVDSLLHLAGASMEDPAYEMLAKIIDAAGDASNYREDFEGADDEDDEYGEYEASYESAWREANDLLHAFWRKYVAKKKPAKKGK